MLIYYLKCERSKKLDALQLFYVLKERRPGTWAENFAISAESAGRN